MRSATTTPRLIALIPTVRSYFALSLVSLLALAAVLILAGHPALFSIGSAPDGSALHLSATSGQQIEGSHAQLRVVGTHDLASQESVQPGDAVEANGDDELGNVLHATQAEVSLPSSGNISWSVRPVLATARVSSHIAVLQFLRGPPPHND